MTFVKFMVQCTKVSIFDFLSKCRRFDSFLKQTKDEWAVPSARILDGLGIELDHRDPSASATRAQAAGLLFDLMDTTNLLWGDF